MEFEAYITRMGPYKSFKNTAHFLTVQKLNGIQFLHESGYQPRFFISSLNGPHALTGLIELHCRLNETILCLAIKSENEQSAQ